MVEKIVNTSTRNYLVASILVVFLLSTSIFALRYLPSFTIPNFYAEDGSVFTQTFLDKGLLGGLFTPFNGYLTLGQNIVAGFSYAIFEMFNLPLYLLPSLYALASCSFLGLTVTLPYILFRKQLGTVGAVLLVIVTAFVPLPASDYAVIGTIGNLKFAFLYWAFLLVVYRCITDLDTRKALIIDALLLLSVLTYAPAALLLPVALYRYRRKILQSINDKQIKTLLQPHFLSLIVLGISCGIYLATVYFQGIPRIQGYLDSPYQDAATMKLLYRSTLYSWLFPYTDGFNNILVSLISIVAFFVAFIINKKQRFVIAFGLWAIAVGTISFVVNRPGLSDYFLTYSRMTPDQFFYAQNLVFIFISIWVLSEYVKTKKRARIFVCGTVLFLLFSAGFGSSFGSNDVGYKETGTAYQNITKACNVAPESKKVKLYLYPGPDWEWLVDKHVACKNE